VDPRILDFSRDSNFRLLGRPSVVSRYTDWLVVIVVVVVVAATIAVVVLTAPGCLPKGDRSQVRCSAVSPPQPGSEWI
jgi:hypothetical protein